MGMLAGFDNNLVKPIQRTMFDHLAAALVRPAAVISMASNGSALPAREVPQSHQRRLRHGALTK
jgi:hypothetical protein